MSGEETPVGVTASSKTLCAGAAIHYFNTVLLQRRQPPDRDTTVNAVFIVLLAVLIAPGTHAGAADSAETLEASGKARFEAGSMVEAEEAYRAALAMYRADDDSTGAARLSRALGLLYFRTSRYDSSLVYYADARTLYRRLGDERAYGAMVNSIGAAYYQLGFYERALGEYQEALDVRRGAGDAEGAARVLTNIGLVYMRQGNLDDAAAVLDEAGRAAEETENAEVIWYVLHSRGELLEMRGDLAGALEMYRQALEHRRRTPGSDTVMNLNAVGTVLFKMGGHGRAMEFFTRAYGRAEELSNGREMARSLLNMGEAAAVTGDTGRARELLGESMEISRRTGNRAILAEALEQAAAVEEQAGRTREALALYKQYTALDDSLTGEETAGNIDRLRIVHDTERKERENEELRRRGRIDALMLRRTRLFTAVVGLLFVLAAAFALVLWRSYLVKKRMNAELSRANGELTAALREIHTLSGLLPICANCKKIRNDTGYWEGLEEYITKHSDARFSHGICPACMKELYPEAGENGWLADGE